VVFKNQARGTENRNKKEFVNVRRTFFANVEDSKADITTGSTALGFPQAIHGEFAQTILGCHWIKLTLA
jgi:hypothetical protein